MALLDVRLSFRKRLCLGLAAMAIVPSLLAAAALLLHGALGMAAITALLLALAVAVSIGLGAYLTRLVVRPMESLAATAREIAAGNLDRQFEITSRDEVGALAASLNSVTALASQSIRNLESLVAERADELVRANQQLKAEIAERQQVEDELKLQARELGRSNAELEQFAYVASHDLQEPLRAIAGFTKMIARRYHGQLDPQADDFMDRTLNATVRMQTLIEELLRYSRVGRDGVNPAPVPVGFILSQELENLQAAIEQTDARITSDELPTVTADSGLLAMVLRNLISNAIKFHGPNPPHVHLSATRQGGEWIFSVRDNGIGLDPKYADRIFMIFQRLHGRVEYPGTGLGLAVTKKAVEYMGGTIWVDSSPGKGSTFSFTIPAAPHALEEPHEPTGDQQSEMNGDEKSTDSVQQRARQLI